MYKFKLKTINQHLTILKDGKVIEKAVYIGSVFSFLSWCESWLEERGLLNVKYQAILILN